MKTNNSIDQKIIIYESSSKGGCYEYSLYLYRALCRYFTGNELVLPKGAVATLKDIEDTGLHRMLMKDQIQTKNKWVSRFYFLYRQIVHPIQFIFYIGKKPSSIIIWNDFEQLTAPMWVIFVKLFARQHTHAIVLHDPDRDKYPPSKWYSEQCMKAIMSVMDIAFYHQYLPDKKYYKNSKTKYVSIVHGVFDQHQIDHTLYEEMLKQKGDKQIITILGNIREEKNYRLVIESLKQIPDVKLLIAGAAANSMVNVDSLKEHAAINEVNDRIIWQIKFLSDQELASCIDISDILLLYYQKQFTSQSGILNLIAPYRKKFVYSDVESGLSEVCKTYQLGIPCLADSNNWFIKTIQESTYVVTDQLAWNNYLKDADWSSIPNALMDKINKNGED